MLVAAGLLMALLEPRYLGAIPVVYLDRTVQSSETYFDGLRRSRSRSPREVPTSLFLEAS